MNTAALLIRGMSLVVVAVAAAAACSSPNADLRHPGVSTVTAAPDVHVTAPLPPQRGAAPALAPGAPPGFDASSCPAQLPSFVFASDSAVVTPEQDHELQQLAMCLVFGPLRGVRLIALGHADAVGNAAYNLALAEARAAKIKAFLVAHGVPAERVLATSMGERQSGTSTPGRRVDLVIAP